MFKFLGHTHILEVRVQLRKKLCYFIIMVLSCCDLLAVLTNNPLVALITMLWLTGKLDVYIPQLGGYSLKIVIFLHGFSLVALLVMNFDRYLATHRPIFHRTSITKGKRLTIFAISSILELYFWNCYLQLLFLPNEPTPVRCRCTALTTKLRR